MADRRIHIEVANEGWGTAVPDDISKLLHSTARQFMRGPESVPWPDLYVYHAPENPITHYEHRDDSSVRIGLNTCDKYWSQYAYQFAHELVHVIAGHLPVDTKWQTVQNAVGWLEESICEAGSLFALRAMAEQWRKRAPYPNWTDYGTCLSKYAQDRMDAPEHCISPDSSFPEWLEGHVEALQANPCQRDLNTIVAKQILPVFEERPLAWNAVAYFRTSQAGPSAQLADHLRGWRGGCPDTVCRRYVGQITVALGQEKT